MMWEAFFLAAPVFLFWFSVNEPVSQTDNTQLEATSQPQWNIQESDNPPMDPAEPKQMKYSLHLDLSAHHKHDSI